MSELRMVPVGDVELCVEEFGGTADPTDPTVVLLAGAASSMDAWPVAWCEALAAGGRHVVRYDHRDTGRSTTDPPGAPTYDGGALDRDAAGLARVLVDDGAAPVHLVGVSMGGGIAQSVALRHPGLVASLTLVATSPVGGGDRSTLPDVAPGLAVRFADPPSDPDWHDPDAVVAWLLDGERAFAGPLGLDEPDALAAATSTVGRSTDVAAAGNHWLVVGDDGPDAPPLDVHDLAVPTLVVHGSHDPLFPLPHGEALAAAVPGARLLVVDGMGHQVPPRAAWGEVVPAILEITRGPSSSGAGSAD